jgi:hypothetical protein
MRIINTVIVVVAIAWVVGLLVAIRHQLRSGGIVVPSMFTSTLLFALGIVAVIVLGASPLHLLWWFPLSFVLGVVVLMFPAGVTFTMACLGLLAGLKPMQNSSNKRR